MYEVMNKDTMKSEILPYWSVEYKRGYVSKKGQRQVIQSILYKLKTAWQW